MIPGDELDITKGASADVKDTTASVDSAVDLDSMKNASEGSGMGILSKLVFFLVICGVIFAFLKTRRSPGSPGLTEKSLA